MAKLVSVDYPDMPDPIGVTLSLTMDEAKALQTVLRRVGGDPYKTARGYTDNVVSALSEGGAPAGDYFPVACGSGSIYF